MTGRGPVGVMADGDDPALHERAAALAVELSLPRVEPAAESALPLRLAVREDGVLELRRAADRPGTGVCVDFRSIDVRTGPGNLSRRQPLGRAIGRTTGTVLDATAGLGHDAALLACMGFTVTAVERSPVIAALLRDGLRLAEADPRLAPALADRLRVLATDARFLIPQLPEPPDAIYIDPMFPPKRKRGALPRKGVRLLRDLVGDDPDAGKLFEIALAHAAKRVVVKRPTYAEPVGDDPTRRIRAKLVRYDVYIL